MAIPVDLERDEAAIAADYAALEDSETSVTVRALSIVGGFFATLVFLVFVGVTGTYENEGVLLFLGFGLLGGSLFGTSDKREAFLATVTVTAYCLGTLFLVIGLAKFLKDATLVFPVLMVAALTIAVSKNYFQVLLATVAIPCCLLWLHLELHAPVLVWVTTLLMLAAWLYLSFSEAKLISDRRYFALRTGTLVGFGICLLWLRWGFEFETVQPGYWVGALLAVLTILGSLLILLVSFHVSHRIGMGLGAAGILYFLGQLYYDLSWTLLSKSVVLMVSGALLLLVYYFVNKKIFSDGVA